MFLLTTAALAGFSANSLLTRAALGADRLDAASFTAVRLATGAAMLALILRLRAAGPRTGGSWPSAAALAGYAIFFTLAYRHIGAGVGALVLFGSVQITMIGTGLVRGERPRRVDWLGLLLALAGLCVFAIPGAAAPPLAGAALMVLAGVSWGVYSLAGARSRDPLGDTAGNFQRASLIGLTFLFLHAPFRLILSAQGLVLAAVSGSLASGVAYTVWYAALPALAAWRAAVVQLLVPVVTALAAIALLHEAPSARLAGATLLVAAGVGLTIWPARPRHD